MDLAPIWSKRLAFFGSQLAIIRFRWDAQIYTKDELRDVLNRMEQALRSYEREAE